MPISKPCLAAIDIAKVCHEANRAYCEALGDKSQVAWELAPLWQLESAVKGVEFCLYCSQHNMPLEPDTLHKAWMREKIATGWTYGEVKDPVALTHPCLVSFDLLPETQRLKDVLFLNFVKALS